LIDIVAILKTAPIGAVFYLDEPAISKRAGWGRKPAKLTPKQRRPTEKHVVVDCRIVQAYTREFSILSSVWLKRSLSALRIRCASSPHGSVEPRLNLIHPQDSWSRTTDFGFVLLMLY
jgi:hypothetical protein